MNKEILDRLPPCSVEDERRLLCSVILSPRCLDQVAEIIRPEDFYLDANQRIYKALLALAAASKPVGDPSIVADALKRSGEFEAIGGSAYLYEIGMSAATAAHAVHYAEIVKEKAARRAMIQAGTDLIRGAYNDGTEVPESVNQAETALQSIRTGEFNDGVVDAPTAALKFIDRIDAIRERSQHLGIPTGFQTFDSVAGGLFPGEFCVLAARPSVGKTALAAQIAGHNAARGRLVYFVSLEMDDVELVQRDICALAGVNSRSIRTGNISEGESQALLAGCERFRQRTIRIDSRPELKVYDIRRKARQLVKEGLSLIVVDYIGLITPSDYRAPREQQVARISRELKSLAKELNVPVLCLSQLNRAIAEDERPSLANLRESGAIEQDAHMVMFIHRPEAGIWLEDCDETTRKKTRPRAEWDAELILAKNRNGEKTTVQLAWHPERTMFADFVPSNYEPAFDQGGF